MRDRSDAPVADRGLASLRACTTGIVVALAMSSVAPLVSIGARAQPPRAESNAPTDSVTDHGAISDSRTTHRLPEGYLGITFVCDVRRQYGPEGLTIYHYGYPAVAFVQPGSPADQAGIVPGDTIVAYDSRDVLYRKIVLSRLLRPGSRLAVRIRRNGAIKNLSVNIAPRPATFVDMNVAGYGGTPLAQSGGTASLDPHQWVVLSAPLPPLPPFPTAAATPSAPDLPTGAEPTPWLVPGDIDGADWSASGGIAGAQIVRTSADLQDALGLDGGLLVITVSEGSAAAQAGLRAGDVIVTAHGDVLDTPRTLARVIRRAKLGDESVTLRVVRHHQTRTVVLK